MNQVNSFEMGSFTGRKNGDGYTLSFSEIPFGFKLSATYLDRKRKLREAGYFKALADPEISRLLSIALGIEQTDRIITEVIRSKVQGEGIASKLFEVGFPCLVTRRRPHVIAFTQEGFQKLYPKYHNLGYSHVKLINPQVLPENMQGLQYWGYKDYSAQ